MVEIWQHTTILKDHTTLLILKVDKVTTIATTPILILMVAQLITMELHTELDIDQVAHITAHTTTQATTQVHHHTIILATIQAHHHTTILATPQAHHTTP